VASGCKKRLRNPRCLRIIEKHYVYIEIINGRRNNHDSTCNRNTYFLRSTVSDTDRTSQQIKQMNVNKESEKEEENTMLVCCTMVVLLGIGAVTAYVCK